MLPYWGAIFTAWYFLYIKNKKKIKIAVTWTLLQKPT